MSGPATGATTTFTYDAYGRVRTVTDADGFTLTYDYDALDRVTKVTYPDSDLRGDRLQVARRREAPRPARAVDADLLRRAAAARRDVKDAAGQTTQYQYGGSGCSSCTGGRRRLTKLVDPNGNATSWEYDVQGRVTRRRGPTAASERYTYETTSSRLKQKTRPQEALTTFEYFLDNNWKQVSYSNTTQPTPTVTFTYDSAYDRLSTMTDGTGMSSYSYYPVAATPSLGAGRLQAVDGPLANDVISYSYDELGRVAGRGINGVGRSSSYDALGRLSGETNALGSFSYDYDGVSRRVTFAGRPSGQSTTYSYFGAAAIIGCSRSCTSALAVRRCLAFSTPMTSMG